MAFDQTAPVLIGFGTESGNAKALASELCAQVAGLGRAADARPLNEIAAADLSGSGPLLIVTSTFGDGEPPGNAIDFLDELPPRCERDFAVFGLGDVSYPNFCQYSRQVHAALLDRGGHAIADRVDADTDYAPFFRDWSQAMLRYLGGDPGPAAALCLQVKSYAHDAPYPAPLTRMDEIGTDVLNLELDISESGMRYVPGDLAFVSAAHPPEVLALYAERFGDVAASLANRELRNLPKRFLRTLANETGDAGLAGLLKFKNKKKLAAHFEGKDLFDALCEYDPAGQLDLEALIEALPPLAPRAYYIASADPGTLRLCVRKVDYALNARRHFGTATGYLAGKSVGDFVDLVVRPNAHFHFEADRPAIMVGAGVGIGPFIGYLEGRASEGPPAHLFFGERHAARDFLYQDVLQRCLEDGRLSTLHTAFSRDQAEKDYVQHAMARQAEGVYAAVEDGAVVYVCGNKGLGSAVNGVLRDIYVSVGGLSEETAAEQVQALEGEKRLRRDLF